MKTFFAALGVLVTLAGLFVAGSGYFVYRSAGTALAKLDAEVVDRYLASYAPEPQLGQALRRIKNAAMLQRGIASESVGMTALSVVMDDRAPPPTPEQIAMLTEAADLMERGSVTMQELTRFQRKHARLLPKRRKVAIPGAQASPAAVSTSEDVPVAVPVPPGAR